MTDVYKAPEAELTEPIKTGQYGSLDHALNGGFKIHPVETITNAWANLAGMKLTFWLALIIFGLLTLVFEFLANQALGISFEDPTYTGKHLIKQVVSMLIFTPMSIGLYMIAIRHSMGATLEVSQLFKHYDKTLPLFLTTLLTYLFVGIGFVLLIVPGIYLMVSFMFAQLLVVDKDMTPLQALSTSRKVIHKQWFNMFGFVLLAILCFLVACLPLLIGLIWALPLLGLAFASLYRDIFGVEEKTLTNSA